jgi:hypothetical protein
MAENTTVIIVLISVVGGLSAAIVAVNVAMRVYTGTAKAMQIANTLLANSFTSLKVSAGVLSTSLGIAGITLQAFYELFREGPEAIKQTMQPFKDFARFTISVVATIGNGVLGAVELVANGINSMVNDAINAINFLNPTKFGEIDNIPFVSIPKIPVPSFGGGSYFSPPQVLEGSNAARAGGVVPGGFVGTVMPDMPSPAAPLPSVGGGGSNQRPNLGGGGGPSIDTQGQLGNFDLNLPANFTINVSGGISTSAEIGKSVVDAITQYTQVYGPVRFATA